MRSQLAKRFLRLRRADAYEGLRPLSKPGLHNEVYTMRRSACTLRGREGLLHTPPTTLARPSRHLPLHELIKALGIHDGHLHIAGRCNGRRLPTAPPP